MSQCGKQEEGAGCFYGVGHGARGAEHRAQGAELRAQGTGHGAQGTGHRAQSTGHRAQGTGHGAQGTGVKNPDNRNLSRRFKITCYAFLLILGKR